MRAHNQVEYTIRPHGYGSRVSWAMSGTCNLIGKLAGMDSGGDSTIVYFHSERYLALAGLVTTCYRLIPLRKAFHWGLLYGEGK